MWVRSQDKNKLIKCSKLYIVKNYNDKYEIDNEHICIGEYTTKEKALKVMDKIQKLIAKLTLVELEAYRGFSSYMIGDYESIFQMPLDSEVTDESNS